MGFNSDKAPLVEMKGICKRFSNVIVLDDVDFTVFPWRGSCAGRGKWSRKKHPHKNIVRCVYRF